MEDTHGETDEYSYNVVDGVVHVHDLHATILHQLRINHENLTNKLSRTPFLSSAVSRFAALSLAITESFAHLVSVNNSVGVAIRKSGLNLLTDVESVVNLIP